MWLVTDRVFGFSGGWNQTKMNLGQVEQQCFSSFFAKFIAYLMIFQNFAVQKCRNALF